MQNPILLLKLLQHKSLFEKEHPRFIQFVNNVINNPPVKDSIISISIRSPNGSFSVAEVKVSDNDVEIMRKFQEYSKEKE